MRFIISGKNIDVTPGLRSAVEQKLGKLERYFTPETEVIVTLSVEKERQKIEVAILDNARNELQLLEQRGCDELARPGIILKWNEKNKLLRDMGLMPIPLPLEWDE